MDVDNRRQHLMEFLAIYHDELKARGVEGYR